MLHSRCLRTFTHGKISWLSPVVNGRMPEWETFAAELSSSFLFAHLEQSWKSYQYGNLVPNIFIESWNLKTDFRQQVVV